MKFFRNVFLILLCIFINTPAFAGPVPPPPGDTDPDPEDLPIDNSVLAVAGLGVLYAYYTHKKIKDSKSKNQATKV